MCWRRHQRGSPWPASLGGFVAQQILRSAPERVSPLALIDTSIHADSPERAAQRQSQRTSVRLPDTFHGFSDKLMRSYIDTSRADDDVLVQRVRDMTTRLGAVVFLRQSALDRADGHDVLAGYRDPLLIVCGANDRITRCRSARKCTHWCRAPRWWCCPIAGTWRRWKSRARSVPRCVVGCGPDWPTLHRTLRKVRPQVGSHPDRLPMAGPRSVMA